MTARLATVLENDAGRITGVRVCTFSSSGLYFQRNLWNVFGEREFPFSVRRARPSGGWRNLISLKISVGGPGPPEVVRMDEDLIRFSKEEYLELAWFFSYVGALLSPGSYEGARENQLARRVLAVETPAVPDEVLLSEEELGLYDMLGEHPPFYWEVDPLRAWLEARAAEGA